MSPSANINLSDREANKSDVKDEETTRKLLNKSEPSSPITDINKAFEECKFGRFHVRLLFTTFAGFIASILVTNSSSFLLPIAECDLNMDLREKGLLNAMSFIGMVISTLISGYLIDTFGRILFLKIGYGGIFIFTLLSATSQNYELYAATKFGEGIFTGIANSGIMSITAEFCHPTVRDRVLICQSAFSAIAQIINPLMAWAILIQNWEWNLFGGSFVLKTWNFYLFAMSIWSLVGYLLYSTLPESPKFLVTRKKFLKARNILIQVYTENTGKNPDTFPYPRLWDKEISEEKKPEVTKGALQKIRHQLLVGLRDMKPLVQTPLITYFFIIGVMLMVCVGSADVLRLWFPQLSTIVEHYNLNSTSNLCTLLDKYTAAEKIKMQTLVINSTDVCVPHLSGSETYINSIIIGFVCIIPYFISGVLVNKVGKKCILIVSGVICIGGIFGIRWATSKIMMVTFFSVDVAMMQTMKSLTQMVLLEAFPTTLRSITMSLTILLARVGSLVGNIGFPILMDMGCEVPFYVMAVLMMFVIVLTLFTPKKKEG